MPRYETDREDLMREATALVRRAEFRVPWIDETIIAGYRRNGSLSIYFGSDPCYHFDADVRLRRAFIEGCLYRTQGATLARLERRRRANHVELERHDLTPSELGKVVREMVDNLSRLQASLSREAECLHAVPDGANVQSELVLSLLRIHKSPGTLAPAIRGKA